GAAAWVRDLRGVLGVLDRRHRGDRARDGLLPGRLLAWDQWAPSGGGSDSGPDGDCAAADQVEWARLGDLRRPATGDDSGHYAAGLRTYQSAAEHPGPPPDLFPGLWRAGLSWRAPRRRDTDGGDL